jgi:hypothetical protein
VFCDEIPLLLSPSLLFYSTTEWETAWSNWPVYFLLLCTYPMGILVCDACFIVAGGMFGSGMRRAFWSGGMIRYRVIFC